MINLKKKTIIGTYNFTVVYTINNFRVDGNYIKWDSFKFYTPEGTLTENETGYKYFNVSTEEYLLERHPLLHKNLLIKVDETNGLMAIEVEEGSNGEMIEFGLEGDIIITGYIPSTSNGSDIEIQYKEVTG